VSVAVLCNAGDANPTQYARAVADAYLGAAVTAPPAGAGAGRGAPPSAPFAPAAADLASFAGRYASEEAEAVLTVALEGATLVVKRRPDVVLRMRPIEKDAFAVPSLGTVTFRRDAAGRVDGLSVKLARVWDMRFHRQP
jgi:hypothetical protein